MELTDLYRDVILDHNRRPRNFGPLEQANALAEGFNPLCGDRLTLRLNLADDRIENIRFEGQGCAISTASASLMTEAVKGKTRGEALALFDRVHRLLTDDAADG
jgi:nitrogen fixation NifU-like protein